jgi:hypothetical protein
VSADLDAARERRLRVAVNRAFAARDGDPAEFRRLCEQVVDAYFEFGPVCRCHTCGTRFRFPGLLYAHRVHVHGEAA